MRYTNLLPASVREYFWHLRQQLKYRHSSIGDYTRITGSVLGEHTSIGAFVRIHESSLGRYTFVRDRAEISRAHIGSFCSLAPGVSIGVGQHPLEDTISTHPAFYERCPRLGWTFVTKQLHEPLRTTHIGHDVWIGQNAIIKSGITIGSGAVVGAGAVVTRDVPPFAIVVGVPAKILRMRLTSSQIDAILNNPWWNRSDSWLREHFDALRSITSYFCFMNSIQDPRSTSQVTSHTTTNT